MTLQEGDFSAASLPYVCSTLVPPGAVSLSCVGCFKGQSGCQMAFSKGEKALELRDCDTLVLVSFQYVQDTIYDLQLYPSHSPDRQVRSLSMLNHRSW